MSAHPGGRAGTVNASRQPEHGLRPSRRDPTRGHGGCETRCRLAVSTAHDLPDGHALPGMPGEGRGAAWPAPLTAAALGRIEPEFDLVEHREGLAPLLAMLPERERRILLLRFFGGLTQTEIAAQVGLSQMHVSRLLSRTLTRLRRQLATG